MVDNVPTWQCVLHHPRAFPLASGFRGWAPYEPSVQPGTTSLGWFRRRDGVLYGGQGGREADGSHENVPLSIRQTFATARQPTSFS